MDSIRWLIPRSTEPLIAETHWPHIFIAMRGFNSLVYTAKYLTVFWSNPLEFVFPYFSINVGPVHLCLARSTHGSGFAPAASAHLASRFGYVCGLASAASGRPGGPLQFHQSVALGCFCSPSVHMCYMSMCHYIARLRLKEHCHVWLQLVGIPRDTEPLCG